MDLLFRPFTKGEEEEEDWDSLSLSMHTVQVEEQDWFLGVQLQCEENEEEVAKEE